MYTVYNTKEEKGKANFTRRNAIELTKDFKGVVIDGIKFKACAMMYCHHRVTHASQIKYMSGDKPVLHYPSIDYDCITFIEIRDMFKSDILYGYYDIYRGRFVNLLPGLQGETLELY